jgi:hypothetical protein
MSRGAKSSYNNCLVSTAALSLDRNILHVHMLREFCNCFLVSTAALSLERNMLHVLVRRECCTCAAPYWIPYHRPGAVSTPSLIKVENQVELHTYSQAPRCINVTSTPPECAHTAVVPTRFSNRPSGGLPPSTSTPSVPSLRRSSPALPPPRACSSQTSSRCQIHPPTLSARPVLLTKP